MGEFLLASEGHAALFGLLDTVHLALGPNFGLELADSTQHVEQEAARGVARVDALVQHLKVHALFFEALSDLAQMQG